MQAIHEFTHLHAQQPCYDLYLQLYHVNIVVTYKASMLWDLGGGRGEGGQCVMLPFIAVC